MYYIVSTNWKILLCQETKPTQDDLRNVAQELYCDVWVIEGERTGLEYNRPGPKLVLPPYAPAPIEHETMAKLLKED